MVILFSNSLLHITCVKRLGIDRNGTTVLIMVFAYSKYGGKLIRTQNTPSNYRVMNLPLARTGHNKQRKDPSYQLITFRKLSASAKST